MLILSVSASANDDITSTLTFRATVHFRARSACADALKSTASRPQWFAVDLLLFILHILADSSLDNVKDEAPVDVQTVAQGSTILIDCDTDLEGPVTYEWKKQGGELPDYVDTQGVRHIALPTLFCYLM